ncbi:MAG TPA: DUF4386 domain-containing protein [Terracidiphilus sp.]|nr:DUF4386 domain-containing protein [Terracidiphilus sp.]
MIDLSQRVAARVFAIAFFFTLAILLFGFSRFYGPYVVWDNGAQTAANFASHASAIHVYIGCAVIYGIGLVVMPAALYRALRPVERGLALFAALCWVMYACMWFVFVLDLFGALRTMTDVTYQPGFDPQTLAALAGLQLASGTDAYYVGLGFNGAGLLFFSVLFLKSRYIPRTLAAFGIATSIFETICGFVYLVDRSFGTIVSVDWYEMPTMLFAVVLCGWILVRGLRPLEARS